MRMLPFFAVLAAVVIIGLACGRDSSTRNFIPGLYAASWQSDYSSTRDTVHITPLSIRGSTQYIITRRSFIYYPAETAGRKPEYKLVHWTGTYNAAAGTIQINQNGRILVFDPEAGTLSMGVIKYKKL